MASIKIDTSNPELLAQPEYKIPTPGVYTLEVANDLKVENAKKSNNKVVKIELRIVDDGEFKGNRVFDNLVISQDPETRKKTEWKTAQLTVACGVLTPEQLKAGEEIDLSLFKGRACRATIGVKVSHNPVTDEDEKRAFVKQYMFDN